MQSKIMKELPADDGNDKPDGIFKNVRNIFHSNNLTLPWGPVTRRRLARTALIYTAIFLLALLLQQYSVSQGVQAFATGLMAPGAGLLYWANPAGAGYLTFVALAAVSVFVYAVGMVLWFATGNMIAPILAWAGAALAAAWAPGLLSAELMALPWPAAVATLRIAIPLALVIAFLLKVERSTKQAQSFQREKAEVQIVQPSAATRTNSELSLSDVQKMRALLDRSLQPVEEFKGFDWIDQFQTASLRYQLNFVSYALSIASQVHLPAVHGYMHEAQNRLAAKMLDPRVWGYWQLENMWGNLRTSADPVTRDNIMLSGFLSAQIGLARGLVGLNQFDGANSLAFIKGPKRDYRYSLAQMNRTVAGHYANADYGLLACEPNWVFPLCNAITATGLRAHDAQTGTTDWDAIAERFEESLRTEFTSANGLLVPFRSSRSGIAAPMIGGGAMQTLPCLFLNTVLPEVATTQWQIARDNLSAAKGRRAMWPVDIGNYRFNRSASYGACAAAAVEMGDSDTAERILAYLDEDYPSVVDGGVAHRPKTSLWAHALEFTALAGAENALQSATNKVPDSGPVISKVSYPDVLLASANNHDGELRAVMYPGDQPGFKPLTVAGLMPGKSYIINNDQTHTVIADRHGDAAVSICVEGRTEFTLKMAGG